MDCGLLGLLDLLQPRDALPELRLLLARLSLRALQLRLQLAQLALLHPGDLQNNPR